MRPSGPQAAGPLWRPSGPQASVHYEALWSPGLWSTMRPSGPLWGPLVHYEALWSTTAPLVHYEALWSPGLWMTVAVRAVTHPNSSPTPLPDAGPQTERSLAAQLEAALLRPQLFAGDSAAIFQEAEHQRPAMPCCKNAAPQRERQAAGRPEPWASLSAVSWLAGGRSPALQDQSFIAPGALRYSTALTVSLSWYEPPNTSPQTPPAHPLHISSFRAPSEVSGIA
ncbi:unnamed protein product [Gadus morhua 'NCC']